MNLLEGEIIEVTTKVTPTESTKDVSPTPAPTSPTLTDNVVIKTKLVEVTPPTDHASSFVIHQQDKSAEVIATQGENMLVKQLTPTLVNDDSGEELLVSAGTHAHVDLQGIHIPSSSDEAVQLARQSKDLTIRYEKPTTDDVALLALVADTTNEDTDTPSEIIDTTILSDIAAKTA